MTPTTRYVLISIALAGLLILAGYSTAMARTFVICSPITGQLVWSDGSPAAGVRITRDWDWDGKTGGDETTTDASGEFSFPVVERRAGLRRFLPGETRIFQTYLAHSDKGTTEILKISKPNLDLHGEFEGKPLDMRCTADAEAGSGDLFWSTCNLRD